jgi:hypothetical protein
MSLSLNNSFILFCHNFVWGMYYPGTFYFLSLFMDQNFVLFIYDLYSILKL